MNGRGVYEYIYNNKNYFPGYGESNHTAMTLELFKEEIENSESIVDIGCGYNDFIRDAHLKYCKDYFTYIGIDISCSGADLLCDARNLQFSNKIFDLLTSFDVLEHISPLDVENVVCEFRRISRRFIFSISYVPSKIQVPGIHNLHLTVWDKAEWVNMLSKYCEKIEFKDSYIYGVWNDNKNYTYDKSRIKLAREIAGCDQIRSEKKYSAFCFLFYRSIDDNQNNYLDGIPINSQIVDGIANYRWRYSIYNAWILYLINLGNLSEAYDRSKHVCERILTINSFTPDNCINAFKIIAIKCLFDLKLDREANIYLYYDYIVNTISSINRIAEFDDVDFWGYWYIVNRVFKNIRTKKIERVLSGLLEIEHQIGRCSLYTTALIKIILHDHIK